MSSVAVITPGNVLDLELRANHAIYRAMIEIADGEILPFGDVEITGSPRWHTIRPTYAVGIATDTDRSVRRIAVIDLDAADGLTAVMITNWVNSLGELPTV